MDMSAFIWDDFDAVLMGSPILKPQESMAINQIYTPYTNTDAIATNINTKIKTSSIDIVGLRRALDSVVSEYGNGSGMRGSRFKREAIQAWERKYPKTLTDFQLFTKDNMAGVREAHPNGTHADHMKIIGKLWKTVKPQSIGQKHKRMDTS